jgi:hypothetical protein
MGLLVSLLLRKLHNKVLLSYLKTHTNFRNLSGPPPEEPVAAFSEPPGSVYRKPLISYLMRKNEEIRGKRLGRLKRSTGNAIPNTRSEWSYSR